MPFLGYPLADDEIPSIALVGSGGGFRAATIILSALEALEELALLDIFSYVSALSGSSWGVSAWIAQTLSPAQLLTLIIPRLGFIFSPHHFDLVGVTKNLFSSYLQNRELPSLTDFCGNTVGCIYLGTNTDSRLSYKLSDMAPDVVSGNSHSREVF
jgi:phospholipase A2